jgi:antitoxin (DNA-binding transcriptional repressor) of toxin-antitoxin stability system
MQVSLTEAAASLSDLVEAAINGEEVIILPNDPHQNRPAIRLMPIESVKPNPLWQIADEIIATIPVSSFDLIPPDAAANLDRYLYNNTSRQ